MASDGAAAMAQQAHSHPKHQPLATYEDVHRAFSHVRELQALAILALRPTLNEVHEIARELDKSRRRKRDRRSDVHAAIMHILAGNEVS